MGIQDTPRETNIVGVYIDPRVKFVGTSKLRQMNRKRLRAFSKGENIFVLTTKAGENLAVMVPFRIYQRIQNALLCQTWLPGNKTLPIK